MSETETKNPGEKTLKVTPTKTLTLKRGVEQGVVRQSFSHGRTKAVVVEKVKRRVIDAKAEPAPVAEGRSAKRPAGRGQQVAAAPATVPTQTPPAPPPSAGAEYSGRTGTFS